jgi:hypothetical protein
MPGDLLEVISGACSGEADGDRSIEETLLSLLFIVVDKTLPVEKGSSGVTPPVID